jgi:hypothetical protein
MRQLALVGLVALAFGLGSFWATDHFGVFNAVNVGVGAAALLAALALGARRLRAVGGPHSRPVILRGLAGIAAALVLAVVAERLAAHADWHFDWTLERTYEPAEATRKALAELPGPLTARLFYDPLDPRKRRTRLLLETLARYGDVRVREHPLETAPKLEDRFGVGGSNTVVLELGDRYETVPRPTEGALYEALYHLRRIEGGRVAFLGGAGEGDPERGDDLGFSGFAVALQTEGYRVQRLISAAMSEVPDDVDAVLAVAPQRPLTAGALAALRRYLEQGGGALVAFLEPGVESGLERLLADFGLASPDAVVVDPASAALDGNADGLGILAFSYASHPVTRGLNRNRMTFFPGARAFVLRKPRPRDDIDRLVMASARSWLSEDLSLLERSRSLPEAGDARRDYHTLVAAGRYERSGGESRIVAFGDSDFASNRQLRTLYNLDLALNAVHWAAEREAEIVMRPKIRDTVQFPLPVANTLETLYGVGLLVPELLLIAGLLVWLRSRSA